MRFADRVRKRSTSTGHISYAEFKHVLHRVINYTQHVHYSDLHKKLKNGMDIGPTTMAQLTPFIDQTGLIRVGGRLRHSALNDKAKHPILLPQKCHLTDLIIRHYHHLLLHGGTGIILAMISREYWIISGRAAVRRIVHSCVPCSKYRASHPQPFMADLPASRVTAHRPYYNVGIYLYTLQARKKWFKATDNVAIGDLVPVHSPNLPPMSWKLGRITEIYPGPDGAVRTADGLLKRPVVKVTKLPI